MSSQDPGHLGKQAHATYEEAVQHRKELRAKGGSVDLEVYRCRHCKRWHVGHSRQSLNRRIRVALHGGNATRRAQARKRR